MRLVPWERISIESRVSGDRVQTTLDAAVRAGARGSRGSLIGIVRQGRVVIYHKPSLLWSEPAAPVIDARIDPSPAGCRISGVMRPNWLGAGFLFVWMLGVGVGAAGIGWNTGSAIVGITGFAIFFVPAYLLCILSFWRGVPALREDLMDCVRAAGEA